MNEPSLNSRIAAANSATSSAIQTPGISRLLRKWPLFAAFQCLPTLYVCGTVSSRYCMLNPGQGSV